MNGKGERIFESLTEIENEAIIENFSDTDAMARRHRRWRIVVMSVLCALLIALGIYIAVRSSHRANEAPDPEGYAFTDKDGLPVPRIEPWEGVENAFAYVDRIWYSRLRDLADEADIIIYCKVQSGDDGYKRLVYPVKNSQNGPDGIEEASICSVYEVRVYDCFKGDLKEGDQALISEQIGEEIEGTAAFYDDTYPLDQGRSYVLFLKEDKWIPGLYSVMNPKQAINPVISKNEQAAMSDPAEAFKIVSRGFTDDLLTFEWLERYKNGE